MSKLSQLANILSNGFSDFARASFNFICREDQILLANTFIHLLIQRKRHTLNISVCRQVGKTEVIVMVLLFMMIMFDKLFDERIRICICAPERGTSTEFFDRLRAAIDRLKEIGFDIGIKQANSEVILDMRGNRVDKFGLFKQYARIEDKRSTREGRTFHVVIRDEKHLGDDAIYDDEIEPSMTTTGGLDVFIGNGGFKYCRAKEYSDMFQKLDEEQKRRKKTIEDPIVETLGSVTNYEINYDVMKQLMTNAYKKTDNEMFMRWIDSQEAYIEKHGADSHFVRKNLYNEWLTEVSNLIGLDQLQTLRRSASEQLFSNEVDLGLDIAKAMDETILTVTDVNCNVRDWQVFKGEYPKQMRDIKYYLKDKEYKESTGGFEYRNMFVDSTGVGDPIRASLKEQIGDMVIVRGIIFSSKEKDILVRKGLQSFSNPDKDRRLSYPEDHPLVHKFEKQMTQCQKIIREDGKLNYKHIEGGHDDYVDSLFLSMYRIQKIGGVEVFDTNTIDSL